MLTLIRYRPILTIVSSFLLAPSVVWSQATPDNLFDLTMDELMSVKVAVASRSNMSLSQAPSSVSVYNRDEIKSMGIAHLDELLNFIPGYKTAREDQARLNATTVRIFN